MDEAAIQALLDSITPFEELFTEAADMARATENATGLALAGLGGLLCLALKSEGLI